MFDGSPLFRALKDYAARSPARFHTPGHKGAESSPLFRVFGDVLKLDLTELPETDSLFDASGVLWEAEDRASRYFSTAQTLLSAGGATLCIQAMFAMTAQLGKTVVCARNIHKSAVNAMTLLGLEPVWVWPKPLEGSALPGRILPEDVDAALSGGNACAVYLTSPDYYGVISDIRGISEVCRRYGVPLLVDNAHGAHLSCVGSGELHPMRLGADLCCDSAHKTLPVLTGGAWLQIGGEQPWFNRQNAKEAMSLFGSTSPSYLILLSLDLARAWMESEGSHAFERLRRRTDQVKSLAADLGFFAPEDVLLDPVRIALDTASAGVGGEQAYEFFRENGISPEMNDSRHVVFLPSPFNTEEEMLRLESAIRRMPRGRPVPIDRFNFEHPAKAMPMAEVARMPRECVETGESAGRVAASAECPCPPGIPLVMPGERITDDLAKVLRKYGVGTVNVLK